MLQAGYKNIFLMTSKLVECLDLNEDQTEDSVFMRERKNLIVTTLLFLLNSQVHKMLVD